MFARFGQKVSSAELNNFSLAADDGIGVLTIKNKFFNFGKELKTFNSLDVIPK